MATPALNIAIAGSTSWTSYEASGTGATASYSRYTIAAKSGRILPSGPDEDGRVRYDLYDYTYESVYNGTVKSSRTTTESLYFVFDSSGNVTAIYNNLGANVTNTVRLAKNALGTYTLTDPATANMHMNTGSVIYGKKIATSYLTFEQPKVFTVVAPKGASIAVEMEAGEGGTVPENSSKAFAFFGLYAEPTFTASLIGTAQFVRWESNGSDKGTSPSKTFNVYEGDTVTCVVKVVYAVTLVAPAGVTLAYTFGLDGEEQASGTVAAGATKSVSLSRESEGNMTLVLEASPFSEETFQGWTKDGTVVDRWSNPATFITNEAATYSCLVGTAPETSGGGLLCGKYGGLIYADTLKAAATHTIALSATFAESGHNVTCYIHRADEAQTTASLSDNDPTFSATRTLSFPAKGSNSGRLIFADKQVGTTPRLVKILFHCANATHNYALTLKVDGSTIYSASDLSGTFSKTLEVT